jgi:hypothetical protein
LEAESLVTKQRPPKEQLSEVLQSRATTIQELPSSAAQAYYEFQTDPPLSLLFSSKILENGGRRSHLTLTNEKKVHEE